MQSIIFKQACRSQVIKFCSPKIVFQMTRPNVTFHVGFACTSNIPGAKGEKGEPGKVTKGNTGEQGIQGIPGKAGMPGPKATVDAGGIKASTTFLDLTDTPSVYPVPAVDDAHWKCLIKVKHRANGLEFTDEVKAGTF